VNRAGAARLFRAAAAVVLIVGAVILLGGSNLSESAAALRADAVIWTVVCSAATLCLLTVRWWAMARRLVPGGFFRHAGHFWIAGVASLFTPAAIGADVYRVAVLRRAPGQASALVGLILRERLIGLLGYCLFYLGCLAALDDPPALLREAALPLAAAACVLVAVLGPGGRLCAAAAQRVPVRLRDRAAAAAAALHQASVGQTLTSLALTLAACAAWTAGAWTLWRGLGIDAPWAAAGAVGVLAELARWLPLSVQGIGVREAAFALGVERLGFDPAAGFLAGGLLYLLHTAVLTVAGALGAAITRGDGAPP
jgi:glycosyltransferase 2 family protein